VTHVYLVEVDDGWTQNPFIMCVAASREKAIQKIMELYPKAVPIGDDYSFENGEREKIYIQPWEIEK
jgi:hypothetical protein